MKNISLFIICSIILLTLGAVTANQWRERSKAPLTHLKTSYMFPEFRPLPPFQLVNQQGKIFNNQDLLDKWSLIFIGYTSCPDVCPTTMSKLTAAHSQLNSKLDLQVIFVSVDPQRDSLDKLNDYINFFNPDFIAATGEHRYLMPFTRALGFVYAMVGEEDNYLVDHSASYALISPKGEKVAIIKPKSATPDAPPQIKNSELVADIIAITEHY